MAPVLSIVMPYGRGEAEINLALQLTMVADVYQLREYRVPALYSGAYRYRHERCEAAHVPGACERFLTLVQALEEGGWVDCDDAAPGLAAELYVAGDLLAIPFAVRSPAGWHCKVRRGDGVILDPSKILGMEG